MRNFAINSGLSAKDTFSGLASGVCAAMVRQTYRSDASPIFRIVISE